MHFTFTLRLPQKPTAPGSAPRIIQEQTKAEDAHTIRVAWQEIIPKDQNGVIMGYMVFYNVKDQALQFSQTTLVKEAIIGGLKSNTTYCVRVAGYTKIGPSPTQGCYYVETLQSGTLYETKLKPGIDINKC